MDINTPFITITQLSLVPLVMAVVSLLKTANLTGSDHRFAPLSSLVLGIVGAFLVPADTWQFTVLAGATIGCIAAGVYSGVKATISA